MRKEGSCCQPGSASGLFASLRATRWYCGWGINGTLVGTLRVWRGGAQEEKPMGHCQSGAVGYQKHPIRSGPKCADSSAHRTPCCAAAPAAAPLRWSRAQPPPTASRPPPLTGRPPRADC
eukprot:51133-Chlamydomonas_euryale.AAC.1